MGFLVKTGYVYPAFHANHSRCAPVRNTVRIIVPPQVRLLVVEARSAFMFPKCQTEGRPSGRSMIARISNLHRMSRGSRDSVPEIAWQ